MQPDHFLLEGDEEALRRERYKARGPRNSQWRNNKAASCIWHYCRDSFPDCQLTYDHMVPFIRVGNSTISNLVPCCRECSTRNQNLLPTEWQEYLDSLATRQVTP